MRRRLKAAAERMLATRAIRGASRRLRVQRRLVLSYHNILPPGGAALGDSSLHLGFDLFRRQLDVLGEFGRIVPLSEALRAHPDEPVIAITFDDAYHGALTVGFPELNRRGIVPALFVAPGLLGAGVPWWDRLSGSAAGMTPTMRQECLEELQGMGSRVRERYESMLQPAWLDSALHHAIGTTETLAAASAAVEIGAHSWSHPSLDRLPAGGLEAELRDSKAWLEEKGIGTVFPWVAYPYGRQDARVREVAVQLGYQAGFLVQGGWHRPRDVESMAIPRFNVPAGLSIEGFVARLTGLVVR